mmetsp:Transcript_35157/g.78261  ORF Transcript_35157/g.78261 Transcript_35157/m.78261 type:complete len:263 (-) Transcript_35157:244-1032(-)
MEALVSSRMGGGVYVSSSADSMPESMPSWYAGERFRAALKASWKAEVKKPPPSPASLSSSVVAGAGSRLFTGASSLGAAIGTPHRDSELPHAGFEVSEGATKLVKSACWLLDQLLLSPQPFDPPQPLLWPCVASSEPADQLVWSAGEEKKLEAEEEDFDQPFPFPLSSWLEDSPHVVESKLDRAFDLFSLLSHDQESCLTLLTLPLPLGGSSLSLRTAARAREATAVEESEAQLLNEADDLLLRSEASSVEPPLLLGLLSFP